MILSVLTVIQSPLGWSKSIQVMAEFSSRKAARGVRLGGKGRGRGRGKGRGRGERKKKEEEEGEGKEERGVRWRNIYKDDIS